MAPREQLLYLFAEEKRPLFGQLSIALRCADKPGVAAASAEWVLNGKATGAECLGEQMQLARQSNDPEVQQTMRELAAVREQQAALLLRPESDSATERRSQQEAQSQKERDLARKLGLQTRSGTRGSSWAKLADVQSAIPQGSVLIEIVRFPAFHFDASGKTKGGTSARYVAWVIPRAEAGEVQMVDLGGAETIDRAVGKSRAMIAAFTQAISRLETRQAAEEVEGVTSYLADLIYKPLVKAIGDASTLLVSPDGGLWLFPWEALPIGEGKFLIEQKQIRYLVTGRSLLDAAPAVHGTGAVLFADPDFSWEPPESESPKPSDWTALLREYLGSDAGTGLLAGASFRRLPGGSSLIDSLSGTLDRYVKSKPVVYRDKTALESNFKALHGPRVLIMLTHGYFLKDQMFDNLPQTEQARKVWAELNRRRSIGLDTDKIPFVPEPLLRCGLAMTGANYHFRRHDANDGILTGLEILGTDLCGTDLVVLDACETGVGAVRDGEGTAGLSQAFQLAGERWWWPACGAFP